jgi:hypothetical protein
MPGREIRSHVLLQAAYEMGALVYVDAGDSFLLLESFSFARRCRVLGYV